MLGVVVLALVWLLVCVCAALVIVWTKPKTAEKRRRPPDNESKEIDTSGCTFSRVVTTREGWTYDAAQRTMDGKRELVGRMNLTIRVPIHAVSDFVHEWDWSGLEPRLDCFENAPLTDSSFVQSVQFHPLPLVGRKHTYTNIEWDRVSPAQVRVTIRPTAQPAKARIPCVKGSVEASAWGTYDFRWTEEDVCDVRMVTRNPTGLWIAVPSFFVRMLANESIERLRKLERALGERPLVPVEVGCLTRWFG